MSNDYRPHVVKQGDYLTKLAFRHGFDAAEVWGHEKNAEIKVSRKSMDMLAPGDVVHLPVTRGEGLPFAPGTTNRYRATVPMTEIHLVFTNADGTPLAGEPFAVTGGFAAASEPKTGGDGKLTLRLPLTTREVTIEFTERNLRRVVRVGDLDPASEESGARQRLTHLGFLSQDTRTGDGQDLGEAVRSFQVASGLPETGALDDETRNALAAEHGI